MIKANRSKTSPETLSRRVLLTGVAASAASLTLGVLSEAHAQTAQPNLKARLSTVATFPRHYFLENLTVRKDNSLLVTVLNKRELWYVPPATGPQQVTPVLLHTFSEPAMGILETEPDVYYIFTSNVFTTHESYLHRLDLRSWRAGTPVAPNVVVQFPSGVGALNGCCLVAPDVILVADSVGLIWRIDLAPTSVQPAVRAWLRDASMTIPANSPRNQPGVNSLHHAAQSNYLYYTSTAQMLFMRVRVDSKTYDPLGTPEFVAGGMMGDDFCIDEAAGFAYITTHRQNTIDRVSLDPSKNTQVRHSVVGDPFTEQLIGPSACAWGRGAGEFGRIAYVTTDGGLTAPPQDGVVREARVLRMQIPAL